MDNQESIDFLKSFDLNVYKHSSNLLTKFNDWDKFKDNKPKLNSKQKEALPSIFEKYKIYIEFQEKTIGYTEPIIIERVKKLNDYYEFIKSNNYDNIFTSQGKLRPTILEEFMFILFRDLINDKKKLFNNNKDQLKIGSSRAYTNLFFSGTNFEEFINTPQIGINQKDQDFAIYRPIDISIGNSNSITTNLPIVAVENKTYIDKTMLEGSIATAEKIKSGNPYSLFFIVTETYDVDLKIDPKYSKIDQIYVLRKSKRNEEFQPIHSDVVVELVEVVKYHLERNWSDVENKLRNEGKIL